MCVPANFVVEGVLTVRITAIVINVLVVMFCFPGWAARVRAEENDETIRVPNLSGLYLADGRVTIIPHIHCDQAWTADPYHTLEEANRIINETIELLKEHETYTFTMESTEFLRHWLRTFPEKRDEMMRLIRDGRFEWSGTYNMPYEALIGGEELIREYYFGRKWYKRETGFDTRIVWNVDTPGHTFQHPQIMAKAGIEYFFLSGFHPREGGQRIPHPVFRYKSPNGSSVLACTFIQDYAAGRTLGDSEREFFRRLSRLIRTADDVCSKYGIKDFLVGAGTDMVAPKPEMYDYAQTWNRVVKKPPVRFATSTRYIKDLEAAGVSFPVMSGEIPNPWCMIHGPTHVDAVNAMREARGYLTDGEKFAAIASIIDPGYAYPKDRFEEAWEAQIFPTDHNWGGTEGLSTDRIYLESCVKARDLSKSVLGEAASCIAANLSRKEEAPAVVVFNGLSWERDGLVGFGSAMARAVHVVDENGVEIPVEVDGDTMRFVATGIPSVGYKIFYLREGELELAETFRAGQDFIENDYYRVTVGGRGVKSIVDKETGRELIDSSKYLAGEFITFKNTADDVRPENSLEDYELGCERTADISAIAIEKSDLWLTLRYKVNADHFDAVTRIVLYRDMKRIDFFVDLNWYNVHDKELRMTFPVNMSDTARVSYDVPFGVVQIGKEFDCAWRRQREVQNFMTVSEQGRAVTLGVSCAVNDYEDRSPPAAATPVLQPILIASIHSCGGDKYYYRQKGMHQYRFSLTTHAGDWKDAYRFGYEFNHALYPVVLPEKTGGELEESGASFIAVEPNNIIISTFKKAEDDDRYVLRCFDIEGSGARAEVELFRLLSELLETNIIEEEPTDITAQGDGKTFTCDIEPYGIRTYKLTLSAPETGPK